MRLASGDRLPDAPPSSAITAENWANLSHLASSNSLIDSWGGGTSGETKGYDGLEQVGEGHRLTGIGRDLNPLGSPIGGPYLGVLHIADPSKGELKSPSKTPDQDDPNPDLTAEIWDCCDDEWYQQDCSLVFHYYPYCCESCIGVSMMCSGMSCEDWACGTGDPNLPIPGSLRYCLCSEMENDGIGSDRDWENAWKKKGGTGTQDDAWDLIKEYRERCGISFSGMEGPGGCNYTCHADLMGPVNLTAAYGGCVRRSECTIPLPPNTDPVLVSFSPNICCGDIEQWYDNINTATAIACEWLSRILFPENESGQDIVGSCCSCVADSIAAQLVNDCRVVVRAGNC